MLLVTCYFYSTWYPAFPKRLVRFTMRISLTAMCAQFKLPHVHTNLRLYEILCLGCATQCIYLTASKLVFSHLFCTRMILKTSYIDLMRKTCEDSGSGISFFRLIVRRFSAPNFKKLRFVLIQLEKVNLVLCLMEMH